jgi:hypothetical protein
MTEARPSTNDGTISMTILVWKPTAPVFRTAMPGYNLVMTNDP